MAVKVVDNASTLRKMGEYISFDHCPWCYLLTCCLERECIVGLGLHHAPCKMSVAP